MIKFKNDKYRKARGGQVRLFDIGCSQCGSHLFFYQKDGPGILKRLYKDRIYEFDVDGQKLICTNCNKVLGISYIFEKEKRPAYRLLKGVISKKIVKS